MTGWGRWRIGLVLALLATAVRVAWALAVPTIPVGDFATYRESATYLAEHGHLDRGFVYMPAWVWLLSMVYQLGGEVRASKVLGAVLGGLAAGPLFVVTTRLMDNGQAGPRGQSSGRTIGGPSSSVVVGMAAAAAYAFWPAGVALASVVGTDVPTAAIIVAALALLCALGESRPYVASVAFGAAMGVAAYFRAVALPLTVLSGAYWAMRRVGLRATITRTAIAVAMTVALLLPWGCRNLRRNGEFFLTDSHGGITALMGNYPNSEGTHSRALASLFQELTGRTLLMEPHRQTDRAAYAIATRWIKFDPAWTVGMIALRTERLFALEHGLLYWSVYRPGVLPPGPAAWFNLHRPLVTALADYFYWLFAAGVIAGIAATWGERRWMMLLPLPFAGALALTYALFVAEPRYRLSTEVLLFPIAAFGTVRLCEIGRRVVDAVSVAVRTRVGRGGPRGRTPSPNLSDTDRRTLLATLVGSVAVLIVGAGVVRGGAWLRERNRWAATTVRLDGSPWLAMWRSGERAGGPSPVSGASPGAWLTLPPGRRDVTAEIVLPDLVLPAGRFEIAATLSWQGQPTEGVRLVFFAADDAGGGGASSDATFSLSGSGLDGRGGDAVRTEPVTVSGGVAHAGGPVRLWARLHRRANEASVARVLVSGVALTTTPPTTTSPVNETPP